ncbi:MAG: ATP-binding protein, partial [Desulfovibrionaceae bacterium]|nr:ATP-binding protein [Desulfovibrionaceae bacterium]
PLSGERLVEMDALCRRMAGSRAEQSVRCGRIKALLEQYNERHMHYQRQRAETEAKWREVDLSIRELRDTISTGSEAASAQSLAAIKASAVSTRERAVYIFGGCILAMILYLLLLHRMIVRPMKWTAKKLVEIQQGDLHMEMPAIHIRELAEVAELLDRFSSHLSELYTHTSRLEEDSAGKRDLEEIMRALFQVAPDGYVIWNADGVMSASPGFLNLLGVSSLEDIFAHSAKLGLKLGDEDRRAAFEQALAAGVSRMEIVYRTLSGEPRPCEATRMRIDLRGNPVILSYVRDMRSQKQSEEILRQAKEQAEEATMAKSAFLARMSHEIRTPMNGVLGLTHIALSRDPPPLQRQYLNKIQASAKILLGVLNDILDFSKIESGKLQLEKAPFSIDDMLTTLTDLLQTQAEEKNLTFVLERAPDVPKALLGDALRLSQVLLNLCGNALKFTDTGKVTLRISRTHEESALFSENTPEARLHFAVADTGVGMSPEQLSGLFKPFAQADVSTTRKYGGTGLGLTISKLLVELMGGKLEVVSAPGQGSSFSFAVSFALPAAGAMEPGPGNQEAEAVGLAGRRVLLVEDNEINREIATALLEELGVISLAAVNGQEALTLLETEDVDGVLMDIQMPVMDGLTATKILRRTGRPAVRALPVIAMTAHAMQADRDKSMAAGMNDHITKPINIAELKSKLARWIGGKSATA